MNSQGNRFSTSTAAGDCMESTYVGRKTSALLDDLSSSTTGFSNLPSSIVNDVTIPWLIDLEDEPYGITESPLLETVTEPTKVPAVDSSHVATREPETPSNRLVPDRFRQQLSDQKLEAMHKGRLGQLAVRNTVVLGTGLMLSLSPMYAQRGFLSAVSRDGRSALCAFYCSYSIASLQNHLSQSQPKRVVMAAILATLPFVVCCSVSSLPFAAIVLPLSAAISGVAVNGLSAVQSTYLTSIGVACAIARDCRHDAIIMAMTSFVAIMQQLAQLLGHLVTSTVYQITDHVRCASALHAQLDFNRSDINDIYESNSSWPLLTGVYVTLTTSGLFFVCWYLEPIDVIIRQVKKLGHVDEKLDACRWQSLVLLSFLSVYMGSLEAFIYCDITELLMCQFFDLSMIGYVIMCFTACDVAVSALSGVYLIQKRQLTDWQCTSAQSGAFIGLGATGHASVMLAVFLWQRFVMQLSDEIVRLCAVFLLMAAVGATTAIWRITLFIVYRRLPSRPVHVMTSFQHAIGFCLQLIVSASFSWSEVTVATLTVPSIIFSFILISQFLFFVSSNRSSYYET